MLKVNPIIIAIPFFFLLIGVEALYFYIKRKKEYRANDTITNLSLGIGNQLFGAITKGMLLGLYVFVYDHYRFFTLSVTWYNFILCLILFDFLFYWAHRISHESNFFWGAHVVHHQSEEYNLSVALRQSWFHNVIAFFIFIPIPFFGFSPITFGLAAAIDTLYQFWIHTKAMGKLPKWIEFVFNTPSHHRVHHATNPKYIDKNHAGVFIIWDRLFGTFREEENAAEITYGITTPLRSWNPFWANFHYYIEMWQRAKTYHFWKDKWKIIFAAPAWTPEGMIPLKERPANFQMYNVGTSFRMTRYAVFQFVVVLFGATSYLANYDSISLFYKAIFFMLIMISILIIGGLFEQKKWVRYAEYFRLFLIFVSLNSFYFYWYKHWMQVIFTLTALSVLFSLIWYTFNTRERNLQVTS